MEKVVQSGARGVTNAKGFYSYTPEEAGRWEKLFLKFTYEIRALALKYPEDIGSRTGRPKKKALVSRGGSVPCGSPF
jgi:3-hydroxybutyryl-CoA dehydrogenase